ncbi:acyltransferase [Zhongshania sp.]|jgi:acetyltransferase-like isoleucine patch superfamily enzyme|uniref:acyltransferase n=1 Tax=Zhongshania sp. TaxID=1971902 RepID=UPI0039E6BA83
MNILSKIKSYKLQFLTSNSRVIVEPGGKLEIGKGVTIKRSVVYVCKGTTLRIGDNSQIVDSTIYLRNMGATLDVGMNCYVTGYEIAVWSGICTVGNYTILKQPSGLRKPALDISGSLSIGTHNRVSCDVWVRFGGRAVIGSRNAINQGTELRCDELLQIGDYNQISYECIIWDTNTHCMYNAEKRRALTDEQYPDFGVETEKPKTSAVRIGSDCWIGRRAAILRGSSVGDGCVVGFGAVLIGVGCEPGTTVVSKPSLTTFPNNF